MLEINFCDPPPIPFLNIQGASEEIEMYSLQITDGEHVIRKALVLVRSQLTATSVKDFQVVYTNVFIPWFGVCNRKLNLNNKNHICNYIRIICLHYQCSKLTWNVFDIYHKKSKLLTFDAFIGKLMNPLFHVEFWYRGFDHRAISDPGCSSIVTFMSFMLCPLIKNPNSKQACFSIPAKWYILIKIGNHIFRT